MTDLACPNPRFELRLEQLERVINTLEVGLWDWRLDDDQLWGAEKFWQLLALPPSQSGTSADWLEQAHPSDYDRLQAAFDRVVRSKRPMNFDCRFWTSEGEYRWFQIWAEATIGSDSQITHLSGWMRDVHQQRIEEEIAHQREAAFQSRQRIVAVDSLAGGIAHEFNNVLQIVRGYVTFAIGNCNDHDEVRNDLEQVLVATDRASDLTKRLTEFSRIEDQPDENININEVLTSLQSLLRPVLDENVELTVSVDDPDMFTQGVSGSLRQVLLNLCINARDAMPTGGRLWVRAERFSTSHHRDDIGWGLNTGNYCRIWISDSGSGIDEDNLDRIFEPFFSTKDLRSGTGLGLSIVRGVIQRLHGAITVHSRVGVGTSFALYLPLDGEPAPIPPSTCQLASNQPLKLMIVAPDATSVHSISPDLRNARFDLIMARDAVTAESFCQHQQSIDYIIVDSEIAPEFHGLFKGCFSKKLLLSTRFDPQTTLWHSPELPENLQAFAEPFEVGQLVRTLRQHQDTNTDHETHPAELVCAALDKRTS